MTHEHHMRGPPTGPFWEWIRWITTILLIPIVLWGVKITVNLEVMRGNQFTSQDAIVMMQSQAAQLNQHAATAGHPVMVERVGNLEAELFRRLDDIDASIARLGAAFVAAGVWEENRVTP